MTERKRTNRFALAGLALTAVASAFLLAGCGSGHRVQTGAAPDPSPPANATIDVCQARHQLDSLVVTRSQSLPQNHMTYGAPATATVTDAAQVQKVAAQLCSLPAMPSGTISCPMDLGVSYRLTFADVQGRGVITVGAAGCQVVNGAGRGARTLAQDQGFWTTLGTAMGLANASQATFAGSLTSTQ
jgi:hypothetical protein